jgi:hypothetical protein
MKLNRLVVLLLAAAVAGGMGCWYVVSHPVFPPKSNGCFDMLVHSLDAARANPAVTVPDFSLDSLRAVRCAAVPSMTTFTIAGVDARGKDFHIYETIGGKAASGGDSVFDYCYTQDGQVVSQVRITGRQGTRSDSACTYDASSIPHATYSYEYTNQHAPNVHKLLR